MNKFLILNDIADLDSFDEEITKCEGFDDNLIIWIFKLNHILKRKRGCHRKTRNSGCKTRKRSCPTPSMG